MSTRGRQTKLVVVAVVTACVWLVVDWRRRHAAERSARLAMDRVGLDVRPLEWDDAQHQVYCSMYVCSISVRFSGSAEQLEEWLASSSALTGLDPIVFARGSTRSIQLGVDKRTIVRITAATVDISATADLDQCPSCR